MTALQSLSMGSQAPFSPTVGAPGPENDLKRYVHVECLLVTHPINTGFKGCPL